MKRILFIGMAALLAGLGFFVIRRSGLQKSTPAQHQMEQDQAPTPTESQVVSVEEEIFKRAFWKRPSTADEILHAELREWPDENGQLRWQWFIVVRPSPALVKELRDDNVFSLVPASVPPTILDAPNWFSYDREALDGLQSPTGNLRLFFGKTGNILYATDTGGSFSPGAPDPVQPVRTPAPNGRLPNTPPPIPPGP